MAHKAIAIERHMHVCMHTHTKSTDIRENIFRLWVRITYACPMFLGSYTCIYTSRSSHRKAHVCVYAQTYTAQTYRRTLYVREYILRMYVSENILRLREHILCRTEHISCLREHITQNIIRLREHVLCLREHILCLREHTSCLREHITHSILWFFVRLWVSITYVCLMFFNTCKYISRSSHRKAHVCVYAHTYKKHRHTGEHFSFVSTYYICMSHVVGFIHMYIYLAQQPSKGAQHHFFGTGKSCTNSARGARYFSPPSSPSPSPPPSSPPSSSPFSPAPLTAKDVLETSE